MIEITEEHLTYLDELRESGETNMFGARPYIETRFGLPRSQAGYVLSAWMKTFDRDKSIEQRLEDVANLPVTD